MIDRKALARLCTMPERKVPRHYGLDVVQVAQPGADFYAYKDNGSDVLFVAHLDTVARASERRATYADTAGGPVVHSRALDDRLGAYIGLHVLPALGIDVDVLLTVGEEQGRSTASFFDTYKTYRYLVEFDRGVQSNGTVDAVTYQYGDPDWDDAVSQHLPIGVGSYSDISDLEHLGVKAVNWSAGYAPGYHGPRAHAYLADVETAVLAYVDFHAAQEGTTWPHEPYYQGPAAGAWCNSCGAMPEEPWSCPTCEHPSILGDAAYYPARIRSSFDDMWSSNS